MPEICKELIYISGTQKINYLLVKLKSVVINAKPPNSYFAIRVLITAKEINKSILYQSCFFKSKNSLKAES